MNAISPAPHIYPSTVTTELHRVIRGAHRMDQRALVGGSTAEQLWDNGEALLMEALHAFNGAIETTPVDPGAEAVAARNDSRRELEAI
jgi:hypothetical protein